MLYACHLIWGENVKSLKVQGRGKGVRGRFRHWRVTRQVQVRGELWGVVKDKCHLLGIRTRQEHPRDTSHTCPHCGKPAHPYRSPAVSDRKKAVEEGVWLWCGGCVA